MFISQSDFSKKFYFEVFGAFVFDTIVGNNECLFRGLFGHPPYSHMLRMLNSEFWYRLYFSATIIETSKHCLKRTTSKPFMALKP